MSQLQLAQLRGVIEEIKRQGNEMVPIDNLITYFETAEKTAAFDQTAATAELARTTEIWKAEHAGRTAGNIEMFKSVIEDGLTAIKSVILVNGGAAVALLAFLGNISGRKDPNTELVNAMSSAMLIFFVGAGAAVAATLIRYLAQAFYGWWVDYQKKWLFNGGHCLTAAAVGSTGASLICFFWGGIRAYDAFKTLT